MQKQMTEEFNLPEECIKEFEKQNKLFPSGFGCNAYYDSLICWEASLANTTLVKNCPNFQGIFDTNKLVSKICLEDGTWAKVNYMDECLMQYADPYKAYQNIDPIITKVGRFVELVGLFLSIVCILLSLFIFLYFKVLRCDRTTIHINLFIATLLQVIIRLSIYIAQLANESTADESNKLYDDICEMFYILLQYSVTTMYAWMFVEGIYLNICISIRFFSQISLKYMILISFISWSMPLVLVIIWSYQMFKNHGFESCWLGYEKMNLYWILQGPRFFLLIINLLCLFNVIRILVTKLKDNLTTEAQKIRKSLRATILLIPLLGIANILYFFDPPGTNILFLIYTIVTNIFLMYQGVFVSIFHCFLNNEVKDVLKRYWLNRKSISESLSSKRTTESLQMNRLTSFDQKKSTDSLEQCRKLTSDSNF